MPKSFNDTEQVSVEGVIISEYTGTSIKKKYEYGEKVHFFSCNLFQKVKLVYFRFITCKVKHFKSCFVLILMIRAYS